MTDAEPRQHSLRALIDWSYDLCGPSEQLLWARMSVFPAPVDLQTLEGVCEYGALTGDRLLDALDASSATACAPRSASKSAPGLPVAAGQAAALSGLAASVWRRLGTSLAAFGPHALAEGRRYAERIDEAIGVERATALRDEYVDVADAVLICIDIVASEAKPQAARGRGRCLDRTRAGGGRAHRRRDEQQRDRPAAVQLPSDRRRPRRADLPQARLLRAHADRELDRGPRQRCSVHSWAGAPRPSARRR